MKRFKRYIPIFLLILHCGLIFFFSGQNEETSTSLSSGITETVLEVTNENAENLKKPQLEKIELVIRKSAHFVLYLLLGVYAYLSARSLNISKKLVVSLVFCFAYAISDELHQLFIDGRSGEVTDVLLDCCGSLIGSLLTLYVLKKIRKEADV